MEITNIESTKKKLWLEQRLALKIKTNPHFSLRAFARLVDVSPAVLSRVLSGKRQLTFKLAVRIADALVLDPQERSELYSFFNSHRDEENLQTDRVGSELTIDCFNAMKEWYHYGITQLLLMEGFKEDPKWIAKMLSISEIEAKMAIDRLLRLEILNRDDNGKLFKTTFHLTTTTEVAAAGIRHFQKQILEKSIYSLEHDDISAKDITSITISINENKISEAKKEITKFRKKMAEFLTEGEKTRVYNLGIHLIPLSKSIEE
ncbi:MAG: TIGR02147 family protein [Bacteriovoracaceae bacterium]|nr:TIGR02147 family protein [Bacteriovoracaceae bacterium]